MARRFPLPTRAVLAALCGLLWLSPRGAAQPTYKLGVDKGLKPLASIKLEGAKLSRTRVQNDAGFRLQYRFTKDGKELAVVNARAEPAAEVPHKEAGTYTAVLEQFHPTYKTGKQQRGQFVPISNVLTYRVDAGKVVLVSSADPRGKPTLLIECGKGGGKSQDVVLTQGFGYKLLQGQPLDGWPAGSSRTHRWQDPKEVRFELTLPAGTAGALKLHFVDGDGQKRRQRVLVQGKPRGDLEAFGGPGRTLEIPLTPAEVKGGRVEVVVQNLNPAGSAVISAVEFQAAPARP